MNLLIASELSAPPSEIGAFRTFTLYATIFKQYDCLVVVNKEEIDYYYKWIKDRGAHDFIRGFVYPNTERGFVIQHKRITFNNLGQLIGMI